jgi:two-component system, NarL family, response regulator LiaR
MNSQTESRSIQVLLVDGQAIIRQALRQLLEQHQQIEVVGEASTGHEAIAVVEKLMPDVVVTGLVLPGMDGLEMTRQIRGLFPKVRVLICSSCPKQDQEDAARLAGASGYVEKHSDPDDLRLGIQVVHRGSPYFTALV